MERCHHGLIRATCAPCSPARSRRSGAPSATIGVRTNSGRNLSKLWNVGTRHALYHKDGTWYEPLERFPGAYFDPNGYVLFRTYEEYVRSPYLTIGIKVNVKGGIESIPNYVRVRNTSTDADDADLSRQ
jgi:5-methylcytosine-specific restriction protein A